ncbi:hypothetical protein [Ruegeria atlantica]|uniref:hypothetical protein n=1 Tax=Ruegeria atlantica TaxID=81569 RepID=UPI002493F42C|nr:hypothetical protein [Ruegeria atlantica]
MNRLTYDLQEQVERCDDKQILVEKLKLIDRRCRWEILTYIAIRNELQAVFFPVAAFSLGLPLRFFPGANNVAGAPKPGFYIVAMNGIRVRHVAGKKEQVPSASDLQISPDFANTGSGSMKSVRLLDEGSVVKMDKFFRWRQNYVSPYKAPVEHRTPLIQFTQRT